MITYQNGTSWKTAKEGRIVDLRHYTDIDGAHGLYTQTNGTVTYEKSFYYSGGVRYLLEEWYTNNPSTGENKYLYRRMTPYTEEDYAFTLGISGISGVESYLYNGNPENTGFVNPLTGQYEIGEFNAKKKELITQQVTQQLEYYVMQHNQYAGAYGITYDFTLPELSDTDWTNALSDITVIAFVQGIPILGQQYYNNYGLAGSNIVDKEFFIGYNDGTTTPIYYSSRILDKTNAEFVKRLSDVEIFDYSKEAAQAGYYPDTQRNPNVLNNLIDNNVVIDAICIEYPNRVEIKISKGTYIESVKYVKDVKGKGYFYNSANEDYIIELPFDKIHYDADNNITITIDDIHAGDDYSILIRDVDGRTKLITKEGVAPTFTVSFDDTTKEFVINAANLSYGIYTGARIEHYNPGATTPSYADIYITGTSCTNYRITYGNNIAGIHTFKLIRNGDNHEKTCTAEVILYPNPNVNITHSGNVFTVEVNNMKYNSGTGGGTLKYEHNSVTIWSKYITGTRYTENVTENIASGTSAGEHKFTFIRDDGASASDSKNLSGLIITNPTYDANNNKASGNIIGLNGSTATLHWIIRDNYNNILQNEQTKDITDSTYTLSSTELKYIPAKYEIWLTVGANTSNYVNVEFKPTVTFTPSDGPLELFDGTWGKTKIITVSTTYMNENPTITTSNADTNTVNTINNKTSGQIKGRKSKTLKLKLEANGYTFETSY